MNVAKAEKIIWMVYAEKKRENVLRTVIRGNQQDTLSYGGESSETTHPLSHYRLSIVAYNV